MRAQVIALLQTTTEEYETFLMDFYFDWCYKKSNTTKALQKVLTCPPLFNWWLRELAYFEAHFVEDAQLYASTLQKADAYKLYRQSIQPIHNIFSKPLIKKAYDS